MRIYLIVALVLVLASCSTSQKFNAPSFPDKLTAEVTQLSSSDEILPMSRKIEAIDSLIFIAGELDGRLLHAYDRTTGEVKGRYIVKGQGPDDMIYVGDFIKDSNGITALDMFTYGVKRFDSSWKCTDSQTADMHRMEAYAPRTIHLMPEGNQMLQVYMQNHAPLGLMMKKMENVAMYTATLRWMLMPNLINQRHQYHIIE